MPAEQMDLAYRVLDSQLVDVEGRRCGRVDDLVFDGSLGDPPRLELILSGKGSWHRRVPRRLRGLATRILGTGVKGHDVIEVPWEQVTDIDAHVMLRGKAQDLGLGQGDQRLRHTIARLPRS